MDPRPRNTTIRRVVVSTDRSKTPDQAIRWAAQFVERYGAELCEAQASCFNTYPIRHE